MTRFAIHGQLAFARLHEGILSDIFLMYILFKEEFLWKLFIVLQLTIHI